MDITVDFVLTPVTCVLWSPFLIFKFKALIEKTRCNHGGMKHSDSNILFRFFLPPRAHHPTNCMSRITTLTAPFTRGAE
jgi:hypothetical protein